MPTTQSESIVQKQAEQVRDYINKPRKHYELRQDKQLFAQLCSSLDVIEDTEVAISAFKEIAFKGRIGIHYLVVYGLLQAIYVQQDAIDNLCESLGVQKQINNYPKLKKIREARNDIIGHPTKRGSKAPFSYHHISRISLTQNSFTVLSRFGDGTSQARHVNLHELVAEQRRYISDILFALIANMKAEEVVHKKTFRKKKLAKIFSEMMNYYFEKVFDGIFNEENTEYAAHMLEEINKVVQNFREAIGRRDMDAHERLTDTYNLIEHTIIHLRKYFRAKTASEKSEVEKLTARIFTTFLRDEVDGLKKYANEIDKECLK